MGCNGCKDMFQAIFPEMVHKNFVNSSNSYGVWGCAVTPSAGYLGQEYSGQCNAFWSKIKSNCWAWSVNRNFVVSVKIKILTEEKLWFWCYTKNWLKWFAKKKVDPRIVIRGWLIQTLKDIVICCSCFS